MSHTYLHVYTYVLCTLPQCTAYTCVVHIHMYMCVDTPASRAVAQCSRKTLSGGVRREMHAGAQATFVVTTARGEYRDQTTDRVKREVGTPKFLHGADLDKLTSFAQDRDAWALLVSRTKHKAKQQWVQSDGGRGGREVPWSHTPIIRVRADDVRVPRRAEVVPRVLVFDEVEAEEEDD